MSNLIPLGLTNGLINRTLHEMRQDLTRLWEEGDARVASFWSPPVNVRETSDALEISLDLPGVQREDVELDLEGSTLVLRGTRRMEPEHRDGKFHRVEKVYGRFERSFLLPSSVDKDRVAATLKDGVLQLSFPKLEAARRRTIEIQAG